MFWWRKKQAHVAPTKQTIAPAKTNAAPAKKDDSRDKLALVIDGLDVSPDAAGELSFESIKALWPDFRIVSDNKDWLQCARGEEYSTLFNINKPKGLFEIIINDRARSDFLGIKSQNPEDLWMSHGFRMYENAQRSARFTDGRVRLLARYGSRTGGVHGVTELNYVIVTKDDAKPAPARRGTWVSLGSRDYARILYFDNEKERNEAFLIITSNFDCLHIEKRDAMNDRVMYPFWLVVSASDDFAALSRLCEQKGHGWNESQSAAYELVRRDSFELA